MKIAIVQLCRLGDIVQTLPTAAGLTDDGHEVTLIVRRGFHQLPIPGDVAHRVEALPTLEPPCVTGVDCAERLEELARWLGPLRSRGFDLAINLSHDDTSVLVTSLLGASASRGLHLGRDRTLLAPDPWTQYLMTIPSHRRAGAFNLADVYARVAGTTLRPRRQVLRPAESLRVEARQSLLRELGRPLVGLVPGASDARKRWPAASFGEVGAQLHREGAASVVLGTADEKPLAEAVVAFSGSVTRDLAGATRLPELLAVLAELDLVVTNDTGTMHLAAAVGTRTLTVTLGPAATHESAPYGNAHVSFEPVLHCHPCEFASFCGEPVCHDEVSPNEVATVAARLLRNLPPVLEPRPGRRVYETTLDDAGLLVQRSLSPHAGNAEDVIRRVYRRLWQSVLSGVTSAASTERRRGRTPGSARRDGAPPTRVRWTSARNPRRGSGTRGRRAPRGHGAGLSGSD